MWYHDAVLVMKVGSKFVQVAFGEVIGNAFKCDDKKYNDDKEKLLKGKKDMALIIFLKKITDMIIFIYSNAISSF